MLDRDKGIVETVFVDAGVSERIVGALVFAQSGRVLEGEATVGMRTHVRLGARGTMGFEDMGPQCAVFEEFLGAMFASKLNRSLLPLMHIFLVNLEMLLGPESTLTGAWGVGQRRGC